MCVSGEIRAEVSPSLAERFNCYAPLSSPVWHYSDPWIPAVSSFCTGLLHPTNYCINIPIRITLLMKALSSSWWASVCLCVCVSVINLSTLGSIQLHLMACPVARTLTFPELLIKYCTSGAPALLGFLGVLLNECTCASLLVYLRTGLLS